MLGAYTAAFCLDVALLTAHEPGRRSAGPPKAVYLLGADDYAEEDVPEDAFVVYQVRVC